MLSQVQEVLITSSLAKIGHQWTSVAGHLGIGSPEIMTIMPNDAKTSDYTKAAWVLRWLLDEKNISMQALGDALANAGRRDKATEVWALVSAYPPRPAPIAAQPRPVQAPILQKYQWFLLNDTKIKQSHPDITDVEYVHAVSTYSEIIVYVAADAIDPDEVSAVAQSLSVYPLKFEKSVGFEPMPPPAAEYDPRMDKSIGFSVADGPRCKLFATLGSKIGDKWDQVADAMGMQARTIRNTMSRDQTRSAYSECQAFLHAVHMRGETWNSLLGGIHKVGLFDIEDGLRRDLRALFN